MYIYGFLIKSFLKVLNASTMVMISDNTIKINLVKNSIKIRSFSTLLFSLLFVHVYKEKNDIIW